MNKIVVEAGELPASVIIYISGPMTGKELLNFPAFFDAEEKLSRYETRRSEIGCNATSLGYCPFVKEVVIVYG